MPKIPESFTKKDAELFASWDYIYGKTLPFSLSFSKHFDFGNIDININLSHGKIEDVKVFTDALDYTLSEKIEAVLKGCELEISDIEKQLNKIISDNIL